MMNKRITRNFLFLLLAYLFLLNGCSTSSYKDGPPNFHVDASKIQDATPRNEPLSKYGNYHRYVVWGKAYHTLPSSKGYEEIGTASWYGTKFWRRHTSSGERYDILAMTAAHKTLPLPTYVQVTNLRNGRQVIVKVNDRGPFHGNRLIDVSYAAALKLGMTGRGTTLVDVKAIDPDQYARSNQKFIPMRLASINENGRVSINHFSRTAHAPHAQYASTKHNKRNPQIYVQVGAFKNRTNAVKLQTRLTQMTSSPVRISLYKRVYHVLVGPFKDVASTTQLTEKLKSLGLSSKLA